MDFQITKKNWLEFNTVDVEEEEDDDDDEEEIKPGFLKRRHLCIQASLWN